MYKSPLPAKILLGHFAREIHATDARANQRIFHFAPIWVGDRIDCTLLGRKTLKMVSVPNSIEHRQLDFIQRVGRIGYWEYDAKNRSLSLANAAMDLLASILGGTPHATRPLLAAMSGAEQARWQTALDDAVANQKTLHIDLKLARCDGQPAYIAVQGAPVDAAQESGLYAGTFQDITTQRCREADHEEVITQLQALLDALPQAVSVVDKDLRLIVEQAGS